MKNDKQAFSRLNVSRREKQISTGSSKVVIGTPNSSNKSMSITGNPLAPIVTLVTKVPWISSGRSTLTSIPLSTDTLLERETEGKIEGDGVEDELSDGAAGAMSNTDTLGSSAIIGVGDTELERERDGDCAIVGELLSELVIELVGDLLSDTEFDFDGADVCVELGAAEALNEAVEDARAVNEREAVSDPVMLMLGDGDDEREAELVGDKDPVLLGDGVLVLEIDRDIEGDKEIDIEMEKLSDTDRLIDVLAVSVTDAVVDALRVPVPETESEMEGVRDRELDNERELLGDCETVSLVVLVDDGVRDVVGVPV